METATAPEASARQMPSCGVTSDSLLPNTVINLFDVLISNSWGIRKRNFFKAVTNKNVCVSKQDEVFVSHLLQIHAKFCTEQTCLNQDNENEADLTLSLNFSPNLKSVSEIDPADLLHKTLSDDSADETGTGLSNPIPVSLELHCDDDVTESDSSYNIGNTSSLELGAKQEDQDGQRSGQEEISMKSGSVQLRKGRIVLQDIRMRAIRCESCDKELVESGCKSSGESGEWIVSTKCDACWSGAVSTSLPVPNKVIKREVDIDIEEENQEHLDQSQQIRQVKRIKSDADITVEETVQVGGDPDEAVDTFVDDTASTSEAPSVSQKDASTLSKFKMSYKKPYRMCIFCNKLKSKLTRHIKDKHVNEERVQRALKLPKKERDLEFDRMKKEGIRRQNIRQAVKDNPTYIRERTPNIEDHSAPVMCNVCNGFYSKKFLKRHTRRCTTNSEGPVLGDEAVAERNRSMSHSTEHSEKSVCKETEQENQQNVTATMDVPEQDGQYIDENLGHSKDINQYMYQAQLAIKETPVVGKSLMHMDEVDTFVDDTTSSTSEAPSVSQKDASTLSKFKMSYKKPYRMCIFCYKLKSKLTRHIKDKHVNEERVQRALKLPKKERDLEFDRMKKEGIRRQNIRQAGKDNPTYIRERTPIIEDHSAPVMCNVCNGFYSKKFLKRHTRRCTTNSEGPVRGDEVVAERNRSMSHSTEHSEESVCKELEQENPQSVTATMDVPEQDAQYNDKKLGHCEDINQYMYLTQLAIKETPVVGKSLMHMDEGDWKRTRN